MNPQIVDYSEGPLAERGWKWVVSGNSAVNGKVTESSGS
jgi:hypothetical protein